MSKPYEYNQKSIKVEGNFSADENWKFWFHDNHPTCYNRDSKSFILGTLCTLRSIILATLRVFSTKTQYFTPMFLKPRVEVQFFLKGSKLGRDKNSETPNFKHFRPETSMGKMLKVLQNIFCNKLFSRKK